MKKLVNLSLALFAFAAMVSCSGAKNFGDMDSGFGDGANLIDLTCNPEVLALTNGIVGTTITVDFPADYFESYVIAKITPAIVFESGEVVGAPFYYQGSSVDDNYTVVSSNGGKYTQSVEFPYSEEMKLSELQLRVELRNAKKAKYGYYLVNANTGELLSKSEDAIVAAAPSAAATALYQECGVVVAKGVNTLQQDIKYGELMDVMPNNYKAVTYQVAKASINYGINSSSVKSSNLTDSQMAAFKEVVEATQGNAKASQTVSANGYASPDGPEKFNDKLSSARSASAQKAMSKFFSEMGLEADAAAYGEDWDGFKELVQASNIKDKNLILQVLSLYDSSVQREAEIKNLSKVYSELKTDILPELRRAQIVSNISINGKTDDEMMALIASRDFSELTNEELLYLAESVIEDSKTKLDVLKYTAREYNDPRAYNNMAVILAKQGNAEAALDAFEKATAAGASDATINKNLVLANLDNDNYAEAKKYTADAEASYAIAAVEGSYAPAAANFEGYNKAIANIMTNNYSAAKAAIADCKCADANYLRAVIASAEGETSAGIGYITQAVAAKPELAEKAKSDINLANLFEAGLTL